VWKKAAGSGIGKFFNRGFADERGWEKGGRNLGISQKSGLEHVVRCTSLESSGKIFCGQHENENGQHQEDSNGDEDRAQTNGLQCANRLSSGPQRDHCSGSINRQQLPTIERLPTRRAGDAEINRQ